MENMMSTELKNRSASLNSKLEVPKADPVLPSIMKLDKKSLFVKLEKKSSDVYLLKREKFENKRSDVYLPKRKKLDKKSSDAYLPKREKIEKKSSDVYLPKREKLDKKSSDAYLPKREKPEKQSEKLEATCSRADLAKPEANSPKREIKSNVPKLRLGDRITTLHELVSPFDKADTASVLFEAIEYIKFLQGQVQVLSTAKHDCSAGRSELASKHEGKLDKPKHSYRSLSSRGLCLVPVEQVTYIKECDYHSLGSQALCLVPVAQVVHIKADAPNNSPSPAKPISDSVVINIRRDEILPNPFADMKFLAAKSMKHSEVLQAAYDDNVVARRGIITCFHALAVVLTLVILYLRLEPATKTSLSSLFKRLTLP